MRAMRVLVLAIVLGCSGGPKVTSSAESSSELSPALAKLAWWLGDWEGAHGSEHWIAASGAVFGVGLLKDGSFDVMVIDDSDGPGKPNGRLRLYAMPGGTKSVEFAGATFGATTAKFENPEHDFPKWIDYRREGDALAAVVGGGDQEERFAFERVAMPRAPELEAADRAFSDATGQRGLAGWVAAFEDHGAMITARGRVEGRDQIGQAMEELLANGKLAWAPIASGRRGEVGYTVGKATYTGTLETDRWRSVYVTIWRKQPDGTWKVAFDTGRVVND
jgi:ketosteroid isomerase-like protein